MEIKRGEVYYIEKSPSYAAVGAETYAARPGVIVSTDAHNASFPTVEVVYLTTQPKVDCETHVVIRSLLRNSVALCEQIFSVDTSRIADFYGAVSDEEMGAIERAMKTVLGLGGGATVDAATDGTYRASKEEAAGLLLETTRLRAERDVYRDQNQKLLEMIYGGANK